MKPRTTLADSRDTHTGWSFDGFYAPFYAWRFR